MLNFIKMKIRPRMKYLKNRVNLLLRDAGLPEEFRLKGITPSIPKEQADAKTGNADKAAVEAEILKRLDILGELGGV